MTRVLIQASGAIALAGLESIIRSQPALEVVGSFADAIELDDLVRDRQPDVILLEWLPTDAAFFWEPLLDDASHAAIVVLSDDIEVNRPSDILSMGVRSILSRSASAEEITAAVIAVAAGLVVLPLDLAESWLNADLSPALVGESVEPLTQREIEVLQMLALGLGNKAIASRLAISEHTVKFHISSIFAKLNASSRTEAVTQGLRQGLIML